MLSTLFKIKKSYPFLSWIILASLIISLLVLVASLVLPTKFRAYNTYFIDAKYKEVQSSIVDFSPQQLAEKSTENVKGIIESPNFLGKVLETSGFENNAKSIDKLQKKLQVKITGPQVLYVQISGYTNSSDLSKIILSTSEILQSEVSSINESGSTEVTLNTVNNQANIEEVKIYPFLNALLAFLGSIILGVSFVEFKKYIEK